MNNAHRSNSVKMSSVVALMALHASVMGEGGHNRWHFPHRRKNKKSGIAVPGQCGHKGAQRDKKTAKKRLR